MTTKTTTTDKAPEFRLERWTGREYVPHGSATVSDPYKVDQLTESARLVGLPAWRVVRSDKDRPAKVPRKRTNPRCSIGSKRSREDVIGEYLAWAAAKGLKSVTLYADDAITAPRALDVMGHGINIRRIDPAAILGPIEDNRVTDATPMDQDEYRDCGGGFCPCCESTDIIGGPIDVDGAGAYQEISCIDCDAAWIDVYRLEGFDLTDEGNQEAAA